MIRFHLHGPLADKYEPHYDLSVQTVQEGFRAMFMQIDGLSEDIEAASWNIYRGPIEDIYAVGHTEEFGLLLKDGEEVHILPAIEGAGGNNGVVKAIVGVAIVAAAFIVPGAGAALLAGNFGAAGTALAGSAFLGISYGTLALFGLSLALGGIAMMLAPTPEAPDLNEREDENASFVFNGPVNRSQQGQAIPLVYGRMRVGSVVVSSLIEVNQIGIVRGSYYDYTENDSDIKNLFPTYPNYDFTGRSVF